MARVFVSYRRADSITITGRIYDRLVARFGERNVFKDVDNIPIGVDFRSVLHHEVGRSDVLLLIIGPQWVSMTDEEGRRRLDDPDDFVRIEAEMALQREDMLTIPVLVQGAAMPSEAELPPSLHRLAYRNAAVVRDDPDFNRDISRLIEQIELYEEEKALAAGAEELFSTPRPASRSSQPTQIHMPPTPRPTAPDTTPKPRDNRRTWIMIAVAIVGLLLLCALCEIVTSLSSEPFYFGY